MAGCSWGPGKKDGSEAADGKAGGSGGGERLLGGTVEMTRAEQCRATAGRAPRSLRHGESEGE
jgi:hypothetical protein